jgi:hypothetical protein
LTFSTHKLYYSALDLRGTDTTMGYAYRYDMLNRLVSVDPYRLEGHYWKHIIGRSALDSSNMNHPWQCRYRYDADGNIQRLYRNGTEQQNFSWKMDSLTYHYDPHSSRLRHVDDQPAMTPHYAQDIDDQRPLNYTYDEVGRMIADTASGILRAGRCESRKARSYEPMRGKRQPSGADPKHRHLHGSAALPDAQQVQPRRTGA